ncbi:MAG: pitrilysin family protein, partial [Saprospiraceae bacterium]|nr:pitrilysin family protein [Saprospiraceae bacterium]
MKVISRLFIFLFVLSSVAASSQSDIPFSADDIDITYEKFTLPNGLRLIVHEDHKAPIVAVNVWYHVGSKNEKPGKSGFAHLFEHLMFNGSEHFDTDYFQALESIGGTDLNGTTNNDRTNYFQNVPVSALDQVLWLESDRMGHLLGAIDQDKLDEQRGVVQNEKRQGENQPYGQQYNLLTKAMFPKGHPYSWTVIGEMEDLNAASLDDVHEWFKQYYGAANAVLVVAGAVDAEEVHEKVVNYFGHIPSGPSLSRPEVDIPVRLSETRQVYQDRVPEARIVMAWNTPQYLSREDAMLDLVASVLASGKNSRLYKKLVYEDQTASSASAFQWSKEIAGNFVVQVNVKPGQSVEKMEKTVNEILREFIEKGPSEQELNRVKAQYFANFIKGVERIGGFGGKSDILAQYEVYAANPEYYKTILSYIEEATPEDLRKAAEKWLAQGKHTLICTPFPEYSSTESTVDRSKGLPELGEPVAASFPAIERRKLKNGLEIALARREGVPTLVMDMIFDAGTAADQFGKPGTASLAMNMMDEGTQKMSSLQINEKLQMLGAGIGSYASLDASHITMNTLVPTFDESLALYADIILNPAFPKAEFDRLKDERLAQIKREKLNPVQMAIRVMPKYMYGEDHAYSLPYTGTGFEESVQAMTLEDVEKYYQDWITPNNATLAVVGDISMEELASKVEQHFGDWKKRKSPKKNVDKVTDSNKGTLYLLDRPESQQSVILAGYLVEPYGEVNEVAKDAMLSILGGDFTSRINMNLREDKHWS